MIARVRAASAEHGANSSRTISPEEVNNIKAYFGFDKPAHVRYFLWLGNVLKLYLGTSYTYEEPVRKVISSKFPISLFFGVTSFILSYLICIPLGMLKAVKNRSGIDVASSVIIFAGYVIPGYALGIFLIVLFGGGSFLNWFPISGIISDNFEELSLAGKALDFSPYRLTMTCYMASEFAFLTMLIKNSLMEEIKKDYMRTALVKERHLTGRLETRFSQFAHSPGNAHERNLHAHVCRGLAHRKSVRYRRHGAPGLQFHREPRL